MNSVFNSKTYISKFTNYKKKEEEILENDKEGIFRNLSNV